MYAQPDTLPGANNDVYHRKLKETEVKFLYSYYEQDGKHSPVLGGEGTEYLTDHVGKIIVNIPVKNNSLSLMAGIDHYTSASTDNINPASISSASVVDDRIYFSGAFAKEKNKKGFEYGMNAGYSTEWDVTSYSTGGYAARTFNKGNSQLNLTLQHFSDRWELIFPVELRNQLPFDSVDWRHVVDISISYSQVLTQKLQFSLSAEAIIQQGYLSTPFHRVYFKDRFLPGVENLPRQRIKYPFGIRLNYFVTDFLVARTFYRLYFDDFNIRAHTASIELPVKPLAFLAAIPFYRFHTQSAATYFAKIDEHHSSATYFTSDYDLSAFQSHKIGLGIRYAPINGLFRTGAVGSKIKRIALDKIEARAANYHRSDGLKAWIGSIQLSFSINH